MTSASPVLLPYQQEWIADHSALKVIEKSRRTGVTWAEAADNVLTAAARRDAGGQNVYYIAYNQDMTVEYVQACAMWARAFNHAASDIEDGLWNDDDEARHIKTFTIRFPASSFRIVALTSRPSNLRGRQGLIVIDEAAFHEQLGELLKAAMAMLIWGGRVHVISTHNGVDNPFNALVQDIRAGKRRGTVHRVDFREAVRQGLYRRVCLRAGRPWSEAEEAAWMADLYAFYGDGAAEELDCVPALSGGAWLSRALIESRMDGAPVLRWRAPSADFALWPEHLRTAEMREWLETFARPPLLECNPLWRSGFGMDFGRSGDLSVLLPFQTDQQLIRRFPFALELSDCPFDQQREALFYIGERLPRLFAGKLDARGNGQYLAEKAVQKWGGGRIEAVMLSLAWYRDNSAPFKAALEDGTVRLVRDADHLDDLRAFEVIKGIPLLPDARTKGQDGRQRHGDAGVAYLLAYAASRAEGLAVTEGFESVPRRPDKDDDRGNFSRRMF